MLNPNIESEIIRSLPFLVASFKSVSKILTYLKEVNNVPLEVSRDRLNRTSYLKLSKHLKLLLDYKNNILIISPWKMKYDLSELESNNLFDVTIDITQPYEVYDLYNNLLYSCVNHNGVYGLSNLDKWLIQKSKNMSTYYLKYKDITGETHIQILVVNLNVLNSIGSNPYYKPIPEYNKQKLLTIQNNSHSNVILYTLFEKPTQDFNPTRVRLNGEEIEITASNQYIIKTNNKPLWLFIETPVTIFHPTNVEKDANVIIPIIYNSFYYIAVNTNPQLVNQIFNTSLTNTSKMDNEQLILT